MVMGIFELLFGVELFPALAQYTKFCNDAKFNEKCCTCKNLQMRGEKMNPLDICGIVDVCKNENKVKNKCLNYEN